jgi:hypothetical protein
VLSACWLGYGSDLYIPTIGPPIFLQQNRQTDRGNVEIGTEAVLFPLWNIVFQNSVQHLCSVVFLSQSCM